MDRYIKGILADCTHQLIMLDDVDIYDIHIEYDRLDKVKVEFKVDKILKSYTTDMDLSIEPDDPSTSKAVVIKRRFDTQLLEIVNQAKEEINQFTELMRTKASLESELINIDNQIAEIRGSIS